MGEALQGLQLNLVRLRFLKALYCLQLFLLVCHFFFQIIIVLESEPELRGVAKVVT